MAKCKCKTSPRIISDVVRSLNNDGVFCRDYCVNPLCGDPNILSLFAPLVYDEIGVNLCTTFDVGTDIATTYPTVTRAAISVVNMTYTVGDANVEIEPLAGRPNCYGITLTNITVQFAMALYDDSCRRVATIYPTAVYLPSDTTAPTYDEDTNPSSIQLEIFAPYGLAYDTQTTPGAPTPTLNTVGFATTDNSPRQGINLYAMAKLLDFSPVDSTATVGLTLVLQSLYYSGYKVQSEGRIEIPKGSIISPENSDCMRFVAGELLDLEIKPLELGAPNYDENNKKPCAEKTCGGCGIES